MSSGFESLGNNSGPIVGDEVVVAPADQERAADEIVSEAISTEQPAISDGVTDGSEILASIDEVVMETGEEGASSQEDSGDIERNLENETRMQKIGRAAETQNRLELARETLNRVKAAANDVFGEAKEFIKKAAKAFKKFIVTTVATISMAVILTACGVVGNQAPAIATDGPDQQIGSSAMAGGQEGDYAQWRKVQEENGGRNYFGEDLRRYHGDREAMVGALIDEARENPEMLFSMAYSIFTDSQKQKTNIEGMTISEMDAALEGENGEKMRRDVFEEYESIMKDKEHTQIEFVTTTGEKWSLYEYHIDKNGDGKQTSDEMFVGTSRVERNDVDQFVVINEPNYVEKTVTVCNEYCGSQVDTDEKPEDVKEITPIKKDTPPEETQTTTPDPKNQTKADENSGASAGIVTPEKQERQITDEPAPDKAHEYNPGTNTYNYKPEEQASQIGYKSTDDTDESGTGGGGTTSGNGQANDFDASASVGTGEVTGDTPSADGSGSTIQDNLDNATGNAEANPTGDYSQGF